MEMTSVSAPYRFFFTHLSAGVTITRLHKTTASRHHARTHKSRYINFTRSSKQRHALVAVGPIVLVRLEEIYPDPQMCVSAWMCTKKAFGWERVVERARSRAEKQNS